MSGNGDKRMARDAGDDPGPDPVEIPLTDELDLHCFQPREVGSLVNEYLRAAREAGFQQVRIIHGKGTGTLRETVHALLRKNEGVHGFSLGDSGSGGWGATRVLLKPKSD